jgi:hypothetical protein
LTYRWSREISNTPSESVLSVNGPVSPPDITVPFDNPKTSVSRKNLQVNSSSSFIVNPSDDGTIAEDATADVAPVSMLKIRESKDLSIANNIKFTGQQLTPQNYSQVNSAEIKYHDLPFNPENISTKPVNRWSIAAMASPTYYSSINSGGDELSNQLMSSEQPLFSYSGGVSFSYKISKRFSIQSGLYYSSLGQKVDGINSFSGFGQYNTSKGDHSFEVLTSNGTVFTSNPDVFLSSNAADRIVTAYTKDVFDPKKASLQPVSNSLSQNLSYLEFPVIVRYKIVDKTIGINLIGGLSYNLLIHNTVTTILDGNVYPVGDTKGLNPLSLSSSFGMGVEYNLSGNLSLNLEPTIRYYLNPFSVSSGTFMHPYSFGIFSGVSYKF